MSAISESLDAGTARQLRVISFVMGGWIALLTAAPVFYYLRPTAAPTLQALKLVNTLTIFSMGASFAAIVASEIIWKKMLAGAAASDVNAKVRAAFSMRLSLRLQAALVGAVTIYLACRNGVLRAYPAYWVDLAPAGMFWSFLYLHWPSLENLKAEF